MGDDAARTDDDIVADSDARQQNGTTADPDIVSDDNRRRLGTAEGKGAVLSGSVEPVGSIGRVKGGIDLYVGCNQRIVADDNAVVVQKGAVHVDFAVVAKIDVVAVVHIKRRCDPQVFAASAQKLGQDAFLLCKVLGVGAVVVADQVLCLVLLCQQFWIAAVV